MTMEGIQLQVKLGGVALRLMNLARLKDDISAAQTAILRAQDAIDESKRAIALKNKKGNTEDEALRFVSQKRRAMELHYISEDVFNAYQAIRIGILEEEGKARERLDALHVEFKTRIGKQRREEHFMSLNCVFQRFSLTEICQEEKLKMEQEHSDFLVSLKLLEEEERQAAIHRARVRQQNTIRLASIEPQPVGFAEEFNRFGGNPSPHGVPNMQTPPLHTQPPPYATPQAQYGRPPPKGQEYPYAQRPPYGQRPPHMPQHPYMPPNAGTSRPYPLTPGYDITTQQWQQGRPQTRPQGNYPAL